MELKLTISWVSPDQKDIYFDETRYITLHAGRRWGKTKGAFHRLADLCVTQAGSKHLWVDTTQGNIQKYYDEHLEPILPKEFCKWNKQLKVLTFKNKSIVHFGSAEKPENLEGFGYNYMWLNEAGIILKGAKGEKLWNHTLAPMTIEGEGCRVRFLGTPKGLGLFKEFSEKGRDPDQPDWKDYHRTSYDNPTIHSSEIDKLVDGAPNKVVQQEIYAEFLDEDDRDPVISFEAAKLASRRLLDGDQNYRCIWGVDVARFGADRSALCKRRFNTITEPVKTWKNKDGLQMGDILYREYQSSSKEDKPSEILIDEIGVGASVLDQCRRLGLPVRGCNFARKAAEEDRYFQKRDELWFRARKWIESGSIAGDPELLREVTLPTYDYDKKGRYKVESKDDMKKRGLRSPDLADAFIITFDAGIEVKEEHAYDAWQEQEDDMQGVSWMGAW